jgi:hypothetical protein
VPRALAASLISINMLLMFATAECCLWCCCCSLQFGSAITYLYEMAPTGRKGLTASLGQVAVSPGMILGILMCQAVLYGCTPGE